MDQETFQLLFGNGSPQLALLEQAREIYEKRGCFICGSVEELKPGILVNPYSKIPVRILGEATQEQFIEQLKVTGALGSYIGSAPLDKVKHFYLCEIPD